MLFPFTLGMVIRRTLFNQPALQQAAANKPTAHAFEAYTLVLCTVVLFAAFSIPFLGADTHFSINGIYETICVAAIFPAITIFAARSSSVGTISKFLGDLSYPLYIVHYPVMYLFYKWLIENERYTLGSCWPAVILVICTSLALATICLKLYDQPIRKMLARY
jgi:peptidoglycan/LPS O-acetylase OafA/YrhL